MNPAVLTLSVFTGSSIKKQIYVVLAMMVFIMALPMLALASIGKDALSFLWNSTTSDTVYAVSINVQGFYDGPEVAGDTYAWGNCTYWAYALRLKYGDPIPTTWGNANTWATRASNDGYVVDHKPSVGAVFQTDAGLLGHVAYVSSVDPTNGDWSISEMNVKGLDVVDTRTFKPGSALFYNFIHDKAKP